MANTSFIVKQKKRESAIKNISRDFSSHVKRRGRRLFSGIVNFHLK